jgi:hypothetical protein
MQLQLDMWLEAVQQQLGSPLQTLQGRSIRLHTW